MIYGINFNGSAIPEGVAHKFRKTVRVKEHGTMRLVGVGQSAQERDDMLIQASNGRRHLHVETRQTIAGPWYGIYTN